MTYSYQSSTNRLTGITGANPYSFSYDSYGNVTNNGSQSFTYNRAGNMTGSTTPSIAYKYDGHKRRVQKTEGGQTSYTVYGQGGKLLHKKAGGVETDYIYAGSLLIAEKQGSTIHYLHTDLLGSPIAGDNGPAYTEHYRPWGEKKDHPTQLADDVGYTGHQDDVTTGLTYMQARYYDPVVGRFYAVDPVGFTQSNPMSYSRYLYVNNNPFRFVDPDGREYEPVLPRDPRVSESGQIRTGTLTAPSLPKQGIGNIWFDGQKDPTQRIAEGTAVVAVGLVVGGTAGLVVDAVGQAIVDSELDVEEIKAVTKAFAKEGTKELAVVILGGAGSGDGPAPQVSMPPPKPPTEIAERGPKYTQEPDDKEPD